jgi:2-methylisocitrate lyase-like PEP mutase family enzyme
VLTDCLVTGISDTPTIKEIASSITLPLNVVGSPKLSSFSALAEAGVRRISMAIFLYKATYNQLEKLVKEIQAQQ